MTRAAAALPAQVSEVVESGVMKLSPGIKELVGNLHAHGVAVFLISGGFIQMVAPIASMLNIPVDNIYANELRFNKDGSFKDYNPQALTSCNGGKTRVIAHIREAFGSNPPHPPDLTLPVCVMTHFPPPWVSLHWGVCMMPGRSPIAWSRMQCFAPSGTPTPRGRSLGHTRARNHRGKPSFDTILQEGGRRC